MSIDSGKRAITATKNYRLFSFSSDNRKRDAKRHKKLLASMKQYGFLASFPIVCVRNADGTLIVKDGQHRLLFAEELGLSVYYVVETTDFDVAVVNSTARIWCLVDYAEKHAAHGIQSYIDGLAFVERFRLPIGTAFSLLGGTTSFSNVQPAFYDGSFTIRDREWADSVAFLYRGLTDISNEVSNARCLEACMACCRVEDFDASRLIAGAKRHREALISYSTRDGFLEMMETVYNFGRKQLVPLKIQSMQAMRGRNAAKKAAA